MKRVLFIFFLAACACPAAAQNKIQMVTYFPVPYVAYSRVNPQKQLDVGLTSACEMSLGCSESGALGHRPLQAATVNLNTGGLDFNAAAAVKSTNITLGSGAGDANIDFATNLRVGELKNGYTLQADTAIEVEALTLFASHMASAAAAKFPDCQATGAPGAPQVSWRKLQLKDKEQVYLVCGLPKDSSKCQPTNGGRETYTDLCPSGQTGNIKYTWNYTTCKYDKLSSCRSVKKKCLTKLNYCAGLEVATGQVEGSGGGAEGLRCGAQQVRGCSNYKNSGAGMWNRYYFDVVAREAMNRAGYLDATTLTFNGCAFGSECDACEAGKKYISFNAGANGISCWNEQAMYGLGSCSTLYVFTYAMCGEMDDCASGTPPACRDWRDINNTSNPFPFLPVPDTPELVR